MSPLSAWNEHIPFAGWVIEATKPRVVVELGTHSGVSYFAFCEAVLRLGLATECFAVDHWLGDEHSGTYGEDVFKSVSRLNDEHYNAFSKLLRSRFDQALSEFEDGSVDVLHIDGLHTYEAVRGDFDAWLPKMSDRGVVLLHDTNERKRDFEVYRLFAELRDQFACFEFTHGHGLGVVAVGPFAPAKVRELVELDDPGLIQVVRTTYGSIGARYSLTVERDQLQQANTEIVQERDRLVKLVSHEEQQRSQLSREREEATTEAARLQAELNFHLDSAEERRLVEANLQRAERELKSTRKQLASTKRKLISSERRFKRLRSRKSVRLALGFAKIVWPLVRPLRRATAGSEVDESLASVVAAQEAPLAVGSRGRRAQARLGRTIAQQRPGSQLSSGPLVSIVVLTRNGAVHMKRLLAKLDQGTTYRSFEVIVVDNGSTDGTPEVLGARRNFPFKVVSNERNTSFSEGNNQGVELADGELLLFLNNDIEPINPGWLGAMVEAIRSDDAYVASGAELVYPARGRPTSDLTVQHAGIRFDFRDQAAYAVNIGASDPLDIRLARVVEVPAATAAALMVEAAAFQSVGGFDEGYVYGTEDVDLCLKLGALGKVVVTGHAVLFHHESATQSGVARDVTYVNRFRNRQRFAEVWAPRLTRSVRREQLGGGGAALTLRKERTVAITISHHDSNEGFGDYYTAHELGEAFTAVGWNVIYAERFQDHWYEIEEDVDLLISLLDSFDVRRAPEGAFTVAWVRNWVDRWMGAPWFEAYDLVAASSHKAAELISSGSRFDPAVIPLATNLERFKPGPPDPTFQADYVFVGNHWGLGRKLVELLDVHPDEHFLLFGKGWDRDPRTARYWRGHLEYELLPEVYRSSKVVLDDTATHTLPYAFVNGRVFDALSAGALVISDNEEGSVEMFDGLLPTFSNRHELREHLDKYLADDEGRSQLVEKLRELVASRYSYATRPTDFLRLVQADVEQPHVAIKIAVPSEEVMASWGDTHFANGLAHALTTRGMPTEVHILPEWDLPSNQDVDLVIHLRGLTSYTPKPAHVNVLWIISHPDDVSARECEKYDLVLVASRIHAESLEAKISVPVFFMPQATDERRFHPTRSRGELATEVLFVGNSRGQQRPVVDWAINARLPLTVYGGGWSGRIPARLLRSTHFPNEDLGKLYASAKVVLNDHWPDMRDSGFISNRIFDALASGTVVVSDQVLGLSEIFGDLVPTYSDGSELQEIVTGLLADNDRRKEIARQATALVAAEHTFSRRAEQLIGLLLPLIGDRQKDLEGGRFEMSISNSSDRVESFPAVPSDEGTETVGHRQRSPD